MKEVKEGTEMPNVFMIKRPFTSPNFKQISNKQLVVHEMRYCDTVSNIGNANVGLYQSIKSHVFGKQGWVEKPAIDKDHIRVREIFDSPVDSGANIYSGDVCFSNFESAYISKILLIKNLETEFDEHIQNIIEKKKKLIPETTKHFIVIREKYPEYLL